MRLNSVPVFYVDGSIPVNRVLRISMTDIEWYSLLSKPQKRELETLQWELCEQGFGAKADFKMKTCWEEAARRMRQKYPNPDPDKQNTDSESQMKKRDPKPAKKEPELVDFS